jgi:hypothetical protein
VFANRERGVLSDILCQGNPRFARHPLLPAAKKTAFLIEPTIEPIALECQAKWMAASLRPQGRGDYMAGRSLLTSVAFRSLALPQPAMPLPLGGLTAAWVSLVGWRKDGMGGGYMFRPILIARNPARMDMEGKPEYPGWERILWCLIL